MDEAPPPAARPNGPSNGPPRLFTVRIWSEDAGAGGSRRGEVRDIATQAHRGFSRWEDLTAFLTEQLDRGTNTPTTPEEH
jgi:hypothetical protein